MLDKAEFDQKTIEKIHRISDILQRISMIQYTKKRLSLYGGTAINFLHLQDIPRLSLDIDFNYRDQQTGKWWIERDKIDETIKRVLSDLGYADEKIKIQPKHPLTRFTVHYRTKNDQKDSLKIEIGYMRRMPVFKQDKFKSFEHFRTSEDIELKTPISEELFGNKFCTLIYRHKDENVISSRDLYDVYKIANQEIDEEMFLTAIVVDSLMRPKPKLYERAVDKMIDTVSVEEELLNLLIDKDLPEDLRERTHSFVSDYISRSKERYKELIDIFFEKLEFRPHLFDNSDKLNPSLKSHPNILWNLQQLEKEKNSDH